MINLVANADLIFNCSSPSCKKYRTFDDFIDILFIVLDGFDPAEDQADKRTTWIESDERGHMD
jgi:hypothetical protein